MTKGWEAAEGGEVCGCAMTSADGCQRLTWPAANTSLIMSGRAAGSPTLNEADGGRGASLDRVQPFPASAAGRRGAVRRGAVRRGARRRPPPSAGGRDATHGDAVPYRRARPGPACPESQRHPANALPPLVPHLLEKVVAGEWWASEQLKRGRCSGGRARKGSPGAQAGSSDCSRVPEMCPHVSSYDMIMAQETPIFLRII